MLSGPNRLPAGGEERSGEPQKRPGEEDQNAGVCTEAREVSSSSQTLHFTPNTPELIRHYLRYFSNCLVIDLPRYIKEI